jgi:hypothetical protein
MTAPPRNAQPPERDRGPEERNTPEKVSSSNYRTSGPRHIALTLDLATRYAAADLNVYPPLEDGSKRPDGAWRSAQTTSTINRLPAWYGRGQRTGIGVITGHISGNLEMFEWDDIQTFERYKAQAKAAGLGNLLDRVIGGYSERTPKGVHTYYRCPEIAGNTELASRPTPTSENPNGVKVLIETRGEGGFSVMAPSNGNVHPDGLPYEVMAGSVETIATITPAERQKLFDLAETFDETEVDGWAAFAREGVSATNDGKLPGEDFNDRADWLGDVLVGWRRHSQRGEVVYVTRPGKDPRLGCSASVNHNGKDRLCVFSSSTPFKSGKGATGKTPTYSKFEAYAVLNHGGDFSAAARALAARGYGGGAKGVGNGKSTSGSTEPNVDELLQPAPFPEYALPPIARRLVEEGAAAIDCPPDFIATPMLALAGSVIGKEVRLRVKQGWEEYPNLWSAVVGAPGTAKTPAQALAQRGVDSLQGDASRRYEEERRSYERRLEGWKATKPAERGAAPAPPVFVHYFTTDATPEALAGMLATSRGVSLIYDELTGWVRGMDQYKKSGNERQFHLSLWAGKTVKVDRKGQPPAVIERPVVSVAGGIQPDLLTELQGDMAKPDGLLDRFLWSYPLAGLPRWTEDAVSPGAVADYTALFTRMASRSGDVGMSAEARSSWVSWNNENAGLTEREQGLMRGVSAKLPRQLARIALVLHCLGEEGETISEMTMAAAIDVVEYYRQHAGRTLALVGAHSNGDGAKLRDRVQGGLWRCGVVAQGSEKASLSSSSSMWFTRKDIRDQLGRHIRSDELNKALDDLENEGLVERRNRPPDPSKGGRPTEEFRERKSTLCATTPQPPEPPCCHECGQVLDDGEQCDCPPSEATATLCQCGRPSVGGQPCFKCRLEVTA